MRIFVSSLNVPIGYSTPEFPSLYLPLGLHQSNYQASFLYYPFDIWKFTVFWSLLFFGGFYLMAGFLAMMNLVLNRYRHTLKLQKSSVIQGIVIIVVYLLMGLTQGFISGAIIGLLLSSIYNAGSLSMSTWIPFCWGIAPILFNVCSSYSTSSVIL